MQKNVYNYETVELMKTVSRHIKKQFPTIGICEPDHFIATEKMFINMKWSSLRKQ